ncbi:hypothetical protein [Paenibacillus vini]|uniref:hypothetical protein n=1 Tax=Paenibacillus vini TaxID=1476024 RepID=UPI001BD1540D|nr:hypothetical protein [Paenibacillus vini]
MGAVQSQRLIDPLIERSYYNDNICRYDGVGSWAVVPNHPATRRRNMYAALQME